MVVVVVVILKVVVVVVVVEVEMKEMMEVVINKCHYCLLVQVYFSIY